MLNLHSNKFERKIYIHFWLEYRTTSTFKYTRILIIMYSHILFPSYFSSCPSPTLLSLAHLLHALFDGLPRQPPRTLDPPAVIRGAPRTRHDVHLVERVSQGAPFYGVAHKAVKHAYA